MFRKTGHHPPRIEPAYWVLIQLIWKIGARRRIPSFSIAGGLENDPDCYGIDKFAVGMNAYGHRWIYDNGYYPNYYNIDKYFLRAIFFSAYFDSNEAEWLAKDFVETESLDVKRRLIDDAMSALQRLKPKKSFEKSESPRDVYNRWLVAAWSSFWLTNHYDLIKEKRIGDLTYDLEKLMRKVLRFRIRGPAYYYDDKGTFKV